MDGEAESIVVSLWQEIIRKHQEEYEGLIQQILHCARHGKHYKSLAWALRHDYRYHAAPPYGETIHIPKIGGIDKPPEGVVE